MELDPEAHNVDHYQCSKAKVTGQVAFPRGMQVSLVDQFSQPKTYDVTQPTRFCGVTSKNGEEIKEPANALMCYKIRPAAGEPKHQKVLNIYIDNQFGSERLHTKKEEELCVPLRSVKSPDDAVIR